MDIDSKLQQLNLLIMKKLIVMAIAISTLLIQGCDGPMGPQGPQGPDGAVVASSAFELEGADFTADNQFSLVEPYGFDVYPTDVVLVYARWGEQEGKEIWRLLPQTVPLKDGVLTFNFDFTDVDVRIFLEGTVNLSSVDAKWTRNQVFRVVVVPADNVGRIDYSDYEAVIDLLALKETDFRKR